MFGPNENPECNHLQPAGRWPSRTGTLCSWWRSNRASAPATSLASSSALIRAFISVTQLVRSLKSAVKRCSLKGGHRDQKKKKSVLTSETMRAEGLVLVGVVEAGVAFSSQSSDLLPVGDQLVLFQMDLGSVLRVGLLQALCVSSQSVHLVLT